MGIKRLFRKIRNIKIYKPTLKEISLTFFICIGFSPILAIFITFISPSVAEAVNPALGECDIYYNDKYIPCMSWQEAILLNCKISLIMAIIGALIISFTPKEKLIDTKYY